MDFSTLKDTLSDKFQELLETIKETQAYNSAKEQFDELPVNQQNLIIFGVATVFAILLLMLPITYINSSQEQIENFEENRTTLSELLKSTTIKTASTSSLGFNQSIALNRLKNRLKAEVTEEQIQSVTANNSVKPRFIPKQISTEGIDIKLTKLNLNQIISIGYMIQDDSDNSQLLNVDIEADKEDPHYFNVTYTLVGYNLSEQQEDKPSKAKSKRGR